MYTFVKTSFRRLWQGRLYSVINITGLATGITCTLLAVLFWKDERSFDNFHKNNPNLYRVTTTLIVNKGSGVVTVGGTGQVQGPAFKEGVPAVKSFVRILGGDIYSDVATANKSLRLQTLFVDNNFFDVFTFDLIRGDPKKVLTDISSVVITESTAKKFFNSIDVIGKRLQMDADPSFEKLGKPMMITGVVKDPPKNSSLQFDALFTFNFMHLSFEDTNWLNAYLGTFVVLDPNANLLMTERQFDKIYAFHAKEQLAENSRAGFDPAISYGLQPITGMHLQPLQYGNDSAEGGIINGSNPIYSYIFIGIALFILLMAAINFINISIANSFRRSKETEIRKIVGGSRRQILIGFMHESGVLCLIAFLLSILLTSILLPVFNNVTGKQLLLRESLDTSLLLYCIILLVLTILLTGLYPACILSGFRLTEILAGKQKISGRNLFGRGLVVIQFSFAVILLISTIVYYSQMNFVRTKSLGYNPDQIIRTAIRGDRDYKAVAGFLKNELAKEPSIKMVSFGNDGYSEEIAVNEKLIKAQYKNIDENFLATMEIPLKTGRNLSQSQVDIKYGVIVNEAFVKVSGMLDPVGKTIRINGNDSALKIIAGVIKDFHYSSLRERISPMVMYMKEIPDAGMWIKFEKLKQREAMASLERIYKKAMPGAVYQFNFLDDLNAGQYLQEQRWQSVISIATLISFIICCFGLFGLAHLSASQRVKEIGIRKVLGASVMQMVSLLSRDFLKLVGVAFLAGAPVAWLIMNRWLQDFAYRISIGPGIFMIAGLLAVMVAFAAVSLQAIKAAIANPIKSLRTE